jgi:hypothetical protein
MYRKQISQKASPSQRTTPINQDITPSQSYGSLSSVVQRAQQDPDNISGDERQQLESAIGTRATEEVLAGKQTLWVPGFQGISSQLWGNSGQVGEPIQAKLTIGEVGDKYEQEADRVAADVVQRINQPGALSATQGETLQRREIPEEEIQMKPLVQRREAIEGGEASTDLDTAINSARGGGQPLNAGLQQSMGEAMGADFSSVRVHTDAQSDQLNRSIQAKAFTTGQNVFFRQGAYQPGNRGGQELLAHELTHVMQQNGEAVSRKPLPQTQLSQHPSTEAPSTSGLSQMNFRDGSGVIQRVLSDEEVSILETILTIYGKSEINIVDSKWKNKMPEGIIHGRNQKVSDIKGSLLAAIKKDDKVSKVLLGAIVGKDENNNVFKKLEEKHVFAEDKETAARNLLSSSLLKKSDKEEQGESTEKDLMKLSEANLKRIGEDVEGLKKEIEVSGTKLPIITLVTEFVKKLKSLYEDPVVSHASKSDITNQINSTANRKKLDAFAEKVKSVHESRTGLTNTSATNTNSFVSHDFTYLNVYPQISDKSARKEILKATRFLREDYTKKQSPIAKDAHSYLFGMDKLITSDKLAVLALRDPVHPSGGMTEGERKARVENNNPLTKYLSAHDGGYKYTVGKDKKRQYIYNTKDNLFVGNDIPFSLVKNVEMGIYRMFVCLEECDQKTLGKQLKDVVVDKEGIEQEKAIMQIVKWFQYPQLMISGSLSVKDVSEKIKMV